MNDREFEKLVSENKSTIYSVCYMFSKNPEEVDDMFQEVLINIWKGLSNFRGESKLSTWLWRISLNTCITYDRSKKRNSKISEELKMASKEINLNGEENEYGKILHRRISRLQPFDRAIVLLWLENISYEEIGQIVGISTKNVSVRLFRIRQQLKEMK